METANSFFRRKSIARLGYRPSSPSANLEAAAIGPEVVEVDKQGSDIWITQRWQSATGVLYRKEFFTKEAGALVHDPQAERFWGGWLKLKQPWGELYLREADEPWVHEIAAFVTQTVDNICTDSCMERQFPIQVVVRSDFKTTAATRAIYVPSPNLFALNGEGQPAQPFWDQLQARLHAQLQPATVRYGVPRALLDRARPLVQHFSTRFPHITIELIPLDSLPQQQKTLLQQVDAAYLTPTVDTISSGLIADLTDYAKSDPTFDTNDFDGRLWKGATWQKRLWLLPHSATLNVLYINESAYELPDIDLSGISDNPNVQEAARGNIARALSNSQRDWLFIDSTNDLLYAQAIFARCAHNISSSSEKSDEESSAARIVKCNETLRAQDVAYALDWQRKQILLDATPDTTALDSRTREENLLKLTSVPLRVAFWTGPPALYEHFLQLHDIRVEPISVDEERFVTPMHVHGSVISQNAQNGQAAWRWINFLSHQRPITFGREVPARKSTAHRIRYWRSMQPALRQTMETAYNSGRAIRIAEQHYFDPALLAAVYAAELDPNAAATAMTEPLWFQSQ